MADIDWSKGQITAPDTSNSNTTDWSQGAITPPPKPAGMLRRIGKGISNTFEAGRIAATNDTDTIAGIISESERTREPATPVQQQMAADIAPYAKRANEAKGVVDNVLGYGALAGKRVSQFASNPKEFAGMVAENIPNSLPGLAAGLAGAAGGTAIAGPIGTVVGGIAGGTAGGYAVEQGSSMKDQILKEANARGINPTDQAALAAMVKEKYPAFLEASRLKGVGTAATDAVLNVATLGLAGMGERVIAKEARALSEMAITGKVGAEQAAKSLAELEAKQAARNTLGAKTIRGTGVVGAEMVGEGLSEGVGQKLAYGGVDAGDVVDESLLGLGTGVGMAAGRKAVSRLTGVTEKDAIEVALQNARDSVAGLVPPDQQPPATPPLQIGNTPDPMIGFADGTIGRRSEVDRYINSLPPDKQPAARAKLMGLAPQAAQAPGADPVTPVFNQTAPSTVTPPTPAEQAGIDAKAGPLSAAAATAVNSGITPITAAAQPTQQEIDPVEAARQEYRAQTALLQQQEDDVAYQAYLDALNESESAIDEAPGETVAAVAQFTPTPEIDIFEDYADLSDDDFFAQMGATPEETADAIASQPSNPQTSDENLVGPAPDVATSPSPSAPAVDAKAANLARIRAANEQNTAQGTDTTPDQAPGEAPQDVASDAAATGGVPAAGTGAVEGIGVDESMRSNLSALPASQAEQAHVATDRVAKALDKVSNNFWKGETFRDIALQVVRSPDVYTKKEPKFTGTNLLDAATEFDYFMTDGRRSQKISKEVYDHIESLKPNNTPTAPQGAPTGVAQQPASGVFDSKAWNKKRDDTIKESRKSGAVHLDSVTPSVESMRGREIYNVHDPKEKGVIRTVDNNGNVYVQWSDDYSGKKNSASETEEPNKSWLKTTKSQPIWKKAQGGKTLVLQTSLGTTDLKDYVFGAGEATQPAPKNLQEGIALVRAKKAKNSQPAPGATSAQATEAQPAQVESAVLPPELSAKLQEAHKAHGRDVTQAKVQKAYDRTLNEVLTGTGNNGGVKYKIKPIQMAELKRKLNRLENDLSLFGIQPTGTTNEPQTSVAQQTSQKGSQPQGAAATTDKPAANSGVAATGETEVAPVDGKARNSPPMQELNGFKVGDMVDVPSRTTGRSKITRLYTTRMAGFENPEPMATIEHSGGKLLDLNLSSLVAAQDKPTIVTDKAEMRPYRKPDGSVGYEAVPIVDEKQETEKPGTVNVPPTVEEAFTAQMQKQKGRITRLKNEAEKAGSLEDKRAAQLKVTAAEATLRQMRLKIFDAEDAAVKSVAAGGTKEFAEYADLFPVAAEEIAKLTGQNDELDAEMRSYEAKANPTYDGKPAKTGAKLLTERINSDVKAKQEKAQQAAPASANTIFTEDAAAAARARLKAKLGRLNSGIDPEMMMDGITLAGYHMEKGARTFAAFARAMVDDLGDAVKPYLKSWYSALRYDPRASGFTKGMSSAAMVDEFDMNDVAPASDATQSDMPTEKAGTTKPTLETTEGRHEIAKLVADHLIGDGKFSTIIEARKFISEKTGEKIEPGTDAAKRADEAIELGVVIASRDIVQAARKQGRSDSVIFDRLLGLYNNQPSLNVRDSVSLRNQAYSTPVPLAFVASRLANVTPTKKSGEPTAGNGALMMEADPATSTVNEIQDDRLEALRSQGFNPSQNDAATMAFEPKTLESMVMNPPFGAVNGKKWAFGDFTTGEVDHAIALNSLEALKDDGDAVMIIGGTLAREDGARKDAYRGKAKREFFYKLYNEYNVVDHFTVSGDLYKKQGAAYPVDVLVIKGRGKSSRGLPAAQLPQLIDTWEQLKEKLNEAERLGSKGPRDTRGGASDTNASNEPGQLPVDPVGPPAGTGTGQPGGSQSSVGPADRGGAASDAAGAGQPTKQGGKPDPLGQRGNDSAPKTDGNTRTDANQGSDQQQGGRGSNQSSKPDGVGTGSSQQPDSPGIAEVAESGRLQVKYGNFSENKSVNTLVATNHLSAIENAFKRLQERVGDIDEFVRAELQYEPEQFAKSFSAEQVEALALAIDNIGQGKGFIIGDQTGIGKGRVVAAMIRYAKLNGKTPVFVTQMPDLYGDMMRDLNDIGMSNIKPLMTNNNASVPLDSEALAWFSEKQGIETRITELNDAIEVVAVQDLGGKLEKMDTADRSKAIKAEVTSSQNPEIISLKEEITELKASKPERRGKFLDTPDIKTHEDALSGMVESNSLGDHDVIFTTYNQMAALDSGKPKKDAQGRKTPASQPTFGYRNTFLKHFINSNTMLILDESHNAGAAGDGKFPKLGDIVRGLINQSGGVFYSSATFAKNTEVMDVYSKTDLGSAFSSPAALVSAVNSVPMQQITSAMLVEAGQYLRRERSFDGIEYKTETVDVDQQASEDLATAMRLVVAFDEAKKASIEELQNELDAEGAAISTINGGGSSASVESTNFTSVMHNVVGTFLLALKADATAKLAIDAIRNGEKPIITVANTMEMFISEYAKEAGIGVGDKLNATFADVMKRYLDKTRKARIKHANGDTEVVWLEDSQLGQQGVEAYEAAFDFIDSMNMDIPLSPIDHIKQRIQEAGFSIGEITGRQTVVENGVLKGRDKSEMKTAGKKNTIAKYNGGPLDALIINRSGSTGLSMHASATFADQRRRVMIVAQAELDINNHMQMLGRINRTGQVTTGPFDNDTEGRKISLATRRRNAIRDNIKFNASDVKAKGGYASPAKTSLQVKHAKSKLAKPQPIEIDAPTEDGKAKTYQGRAAQYGLPRYVQMTANVPIELRPAAVLSNKMAGLNANTTAGRNSAVEDKAALDFMNKYGDRVAAEMVGSDYNLNASLGFPVRFDEHGDPFVPGSMGRVTGRIGLLPLTKQSSLYRQLASEYGDLLSQLDALGQNDLEAKTYPLDAQTLESKIVSKADKGSVSPFTSAVVAEKVSMKKLGKPYPKAKVIELVNAALDGNDARQLQSKTVADVKDAIDAEIQVLNTENATADTDRKVGIKKHIESLIAAASRFRSSLPPIGQAVMLKTSAGNMYGVVSGVERVGKAKSAGSLSAWKVRIAVVDGARSMTLPMTQIYVDESAVIPENGIVMKIATDMTIPNAERTGFDSVPVLDAFDRGQTDSRETRIVITGNILRGYGALRGRLLNYTDNKGGIKQGILMPPDFDMNAVSAKFTPALRNAAAAIELLKKGGTVIDKANSGDTLRIEQRGTSYNVEVSKTGIGKRLAKNADYNLNFVSSGNKMRTRVWSDEDLIDFLDNTVKKEGIVLIPNADSVKLMQDDDAVNFSRSKRPVFSRGAQTQANAEVSKIVDAIRANWDNAPEIVVAFDMNDPIIPERVRLEDKKQRSQYELNSGLNGAKGSPVSDEKQLQIAFIDPDSSGNIGARQATLNEISNLLNIPIDHSIFGATSDAVDGRTASIKSSVNSSRSNIQRLRDLLHGKSFTEKSFSSLDVKTQGLVLTDVFSLSQDRKILDSIIQLVPVDVMNILTGGKFSPQSLFNNEAVFRNRLSVVGGVTVSGQVVADTLVNAAALSSAVIVDANNIPTLAFKHSPATDALYRNNGHKTSNMYRESSRESIGKARGFYYKGKVYLIASELQSTGDVVETLFHETLGHYGLRGHFGGALKPILQQIVTFRKALVEAKMKEYGLRNVSNMDRLVAAEEVLAEMAQRTPEIGFVKRAIAAIRNWLRANVPGFQSMKMTDNDIIQQFILPARAFVERGAGNAGGMTMFSRGKNEGMTNTNVVGNQGGRSADDSTPGDFKNAGETVDGLTVRDEIPNQSSIGSSVDNYTVLPGVREIPLTAFTQLPELKYYSVSEETRTKRLAEKIKESGEINPLIVVIDKEGPYVLEGGHRFDALRELGKTSFPAIVVLDNDSLNESTAPDSGGAVFSRSTVSGYTKHATDKLNEAFNHPGTMSMWHKTVGSMYNLAERSTPFKRVFDAAQSFIQDVSFYATEAADLAPKILPKLDTWKDMLKTPVSSEDNKAISAPILQGTLSWARNEAGEAVRIEVLEEEASNLTIDQKSQRLLRGDHISEGVLKMWRGLPIEQYEAMIESKFKSSMLKPGIVFTDAELVKHFSLNKDQISLYREFRSATDKSLDNLAKADLLRFGGKDVEPKRDMVMDAATADDAAVMLRDYLHSQRDLMPDRADDLTAAANGMIDRADKVNKLKKEGYAPLSRFGRYSVDVVVDGERQYFSLFESKQAANLMAMKLKAEFGAANVAQGTMSQKDFEQFQGITPESLELFGNMLGLDSTGNEAQDKAFQTYLKLTKTNRSAMKRMIHRKGTSGFSEDIGRVLAAFVYSNARQTSAALHMGELGEAVNAVDKNADGTRNGQGELKDAAIELSSYIKKPREEAQALRGMLFAQYLGGSVASAFVNFTQPLTVSFPYLSQFGGAAKSGAALVQAMKDQRAGKVLEAGLAQALRKAEEEGIVSPQSVHELMAQAQGRSTLNAGDGTRLGDAKAFAQNNFAKLTIGWGKLFGLAEQINRRSTFIAAYRIAVDQKIANPGAFATKAVNETQFISNKANKAKFGRGAIGATLMTFKSYSINYLELLHRMATQNGPEGKKAAALMLGMLFLMAGAGGLPFDDDLEDLADFLAQRLGYNFSSKKAKQEFLESLFGKAMAQFIDKGISGLPGSPIDTSGRMSMGNLIPGTGLFLKKNDHTGDLKELIGPAGDLVQRGFKAGDKLLSGDFAGAARDIAPKAVYNALKGADMAGSGAYNDDKGYKVISSTPFEAAMKAIGFQPASVADVQQSNYLNQRAKDFYSINSQAISAKWAKGIYEKDDRQIADAKDDLASWNEKNPDQRMRPNMSAILKRVHEMHKDKAQRIADTAPKAMRAQMKRDLATAG